ncbi:alcohol dehydrogenase catalytic domain-containing protein [Paenibacillus polysaccharolyticus]
MYLINSRVSRGRDNPILGCDASGEVVAVGDKVTKFKVGDKVITSDYAM